MRLPAQAAKVLEVLLQHAGEIVEREELQRRLWPPDTHVEFETSLNTVMRKLRQSLCDDAGQPRYIETIPKVGYRMIAPVQPIFGASAGFHAVPLPTEEQEDRPGPPRRRIGLSTVIVAVAAGLAVLAGAAVWLVLHAVPDAAPMLESRPFTSAPWPENQPALSSDGRLVAFVADGSHIWVQRSDAESAQQVTNGPGSERSPAWSPEGDKLAFIRMLPGNIAGIFVIPVPGTGERKWAEMARSGPDMPQLDWSPDGEEFLSSERERATAPQFLVAVSLKTGVKRRITTPPADGLGDSLGIFSPDGRTIAFRRGRANGIEDVWLIGREGGDAKRVTFDDRGISGIAWTPDGRSLIISSRRTGSLRNLWRLPLPNGKLERLLPATFDASGASVSRRSHRLVYVLSIMDIDCWRFPVGGGTPQPIVRSTAGESSPQYSPDGRWLAFTSDRSGTYEVWVAKADGSSPVRLTNSGVHGAGGAQWSPDSRYLGFNMAPDHHNDVFVASVENKEVRRITSEPFVNSAPSWSHDGRWIYFSSNRSGVSNIWRAPATGGPAERVTNLASGFPLESPDGKHLYFNTRGCALARQPLNGSGEAEPVFDYPGRLMGNYTVTAAGVFFICVSPKEVSELWYHDLKEGTRRLQYTLPNYPASGAAGMSVSPDGRWVTYAQIERSTQNIQMVERFR